MSVTATLYYCRNTRRSCKENARKETATENFRMGTRGKEKKGRPKERWIDGVRRSMTNHGLTEDDTRDRYR
jgi:hypothetical protein